MIMRMLVLLSLTFSQALFANDFLCLRSLIPATEHYWVKSHRDQYGVPSMSESGSAVQISHWEKRRLIGVFVYSESSARAFDRLRRDEGEMALKDVDPAWFKDNWLLTKIDGLEVFRFQVDAPGRAYRSTASVLPTFASTSTPARTRGTGGAWLVERRASKEELAAPLVKEIALRKEWARNNNLNSGRFKAWTEADKVCGQVKVAPKADAGLTKH